MNSSGVGVLSPAVERLKLAEAGQSSRRGSSKSPGRVPDKAATSSPSLTPNSSSARLSALLEKSQAQPSKKALAFPFYFDDYLCSRLFSVKFFSGLHLE